MPELRWIGKEAVVTHHRRVPLRVLECDRSLSAGDPDSGNLLVEGDNLEALKALLPRYKGKVKCIYIDPPYNTGDEQWVYNDNVNDPRIRKWLGEVVGPEAEDLCRHDKWLCMMYPRLALLREFLREDGICFVSIDENEMGHLRMLLDEIFGYGNALGTFVWKRRSSSAMRSTPLSIDHEYVYVYAKTAAQAVMHGLVKGPEGYPFQDCRGRYASTDLTVGMSRRERPGQFYTIVNPRTGKEYPANPERVWRFYPETMRKVIEDDLVIWPDEQAGSMTRPRYKTYYDPESEKPKPVSSWIASPRAKESNDDEINEGDTITLVSGMTQEGGKTLLQALGSRAFPYPKPVSLIKSLVRASTANDDIILDSFAGSGTTGQAVLELNAEDGGSRKFVLVEIDSGIARDVSAQRLRSVVDGYTASGIRQKSRRVPGLGGGFKYCRLGRAVFDERGAINPDISFADLARYTFLVETGVPAPWRPRRDSPLIGVHEGRAVYLLYNGVLGDRRPGGGNVLTRAVLEALPPHDGPKVVYGEACRLGEATLRCHRVTFKQTPYSLHKEA